MNTRNRCGLNGFIATLLLAVPVNASGNTLTCETSPIIVHSADQEVAKTICQITAKAKHRFEACGLDLERPISITVVDGFAEAAGNCIGIFDCGANTIEVLHPDAIAKARPQVSVFDRLPLDSLFESVIVHELAHAYLHASYVFDRVPHTEAEYVAYSFQLDALSDAHRNMILEDHKTEDPGSANGINDVILALSPPAFASMSWRHFNKPENGCNIVKKIADGQVFFSLPQL